MNRVPHLVLRLAVPCLVVVVAVAGCSAQPSDAPVATASDVHAVRVLHGWDARRADAWATGSVPALRRLYLAGAAALDARHLRAYVDRGLVVRGLRTQLLAARVLVDRPGRVSLVVTDRVAGGRVVPRAGGAGVPLPRDTATTRTVTLVRAGGRWRVAAVSGPGLR